MTTRTKHLSVKNSAPKSAVRKQLHALDVRPSKGRGQNFLSDPRLADQIVSFANLGYQEPVIEVGPGLGILTERLATLAGAFVIIELEDRFAHQAIDRYGSRPHTKIIHGDATKGELESVSSLLQEGQKWVVVSNVPYSISTTFLKWLFAERRSLKRASLLLQREFAERLAADPGGREYGSLTLLRSLYASAELGPIITGDQFYPPAEVESRLILLEFYDRPLDLPCSEEVLERVVRASFAQRRKTILNNLSPSVFASKSVAEEALKLVNIDPKARAETVSLRQFAELAAAVEQRAVKGGGERK